MTAQIPTLIVGAGPAGLAVGQALREHGVSFEIVEREHRLAPAWHRHYERLHLHTAKHFSSLPGMRFPDAVPRYPSRAAVIDYLTAYAQRFALRPRLGVTVLRVAPAANGGWLAQTDHGEFAARNVVLATGLNAVPMQPHWPGMESYRGELLHSSAYVNGARWAGQSVLVVGAGNSGAEIALDLAEHGARAELSVRSKLHITLRDTLGLPTPVPTLLLTKLPLPLADAIAKTALRFSVGDLSRWGIEAPAYGPIRGIVERGRIPVIDVGTLARIKQGDIVVRRDIERFDADGVTFVDGTRVAYAAIVLATGYRPGLERLLDDAEELVDERGRARHDGVTPRPGLYLVGYATPPTGLLREIGFIARRVAEHIARQSP
jgi:pyruvate/2-oxoglutarate dehydrogenase complex dihydrolipoamide dehydrogenase (E3) component